MRRVAILLLLVLTGLATAQERPIKFGRWPSLSPDGSQLAFGYQGNLWVVSSVGGVATRLTAQDTIDSNPKWSPDGKWIAFNSGREGGTEVFLIPSIGGRAKRLTVHSSPTTVHDWYPDGQHLLVSHARWTREPALYKLNIETGAMAKVYEDRMAALNPSVSPDGKSIAFHRGGLFDTYRRNYKGSANHDIYFGPADGSAPAFAAYRDKPQMNDQYALFSANGERLYWAHDTGKHSQLMSKPVRGGEATVVANAPDQLRFGSAAKHGSKLAFECLNDIYVFDTSTRQGKIISIICRTDEKTSPQSLATFENSSLQEYSLSPDGKRTALVLRGELFVVNNERGGEAKRLTRTPTREGSIDWTPDGKSIVFAKDMGGYSNLWSVNLATLEETQITNGKDSDSAPEFSPDGKWMAYLRSPKSSLRVRSADGKIDRELAAGPGVLEYHWSPDSKWIAYTRMRGYWDADIFLVQLGEGGEAVRTLPLSNHPGENLGPVWFPNGEKIAFRSNRYRNRDNETINHSGRYSVYVTSLQKEKDVFDFDEDTEPTLPKPDPKKPVEVTIDPEELDRRARQVFPFMESVGEFTVTPDNSAIIFVATSLGQTDFWQMSADGGGLIRLTTGGEAGSSFTWAPDGSRLYYLRQGSLRWMSRNGQQRGTVGFSAQMEIDRTEDFYAVFDEAWSTIANTFYDPKYHGVDWAAMKAKYRAFIPDIAMRNDLSLLVNQMLGELNASHMGFQTPSGVPAKLLRDVGSLGIVPDFHHRGPGVKIGRVIARSVATKPDTRLKEGEFILEIDGKPVSNGLSFDQALVGKTGKTVTLTVNSAASITGARKMKIKPQSQASLSPLFYEEWIDQRQSMVDKLSGGKLGYVHVATMGDEERNRFERELFSEGLEREGMVLDFRFNAGGDTHDSLLQFLDRRSQYLTFVPRNEMPIRQPERIYNKPTIVIVDEETLSDGEVFTQGYKDLKIGQVVGRPTMAWIIFTSGRGLLDGSFIRTPYIATLTREGRNMENMGVPPDIEVWMEPSDTFVGKDPQLERAVQELMKKVKGAGSG
jgi:tricorn protease